MVSLYDLKELIVFGDLVVAEGVAVGFGAAEIAAGCDAGVAAALHIGGQAVAEDDHTAFVGDAEVGEDVVEVGFVGLGRADLLGDIDAVDIAVDAGADISAGLRDGQAVGGKVDLDVVFLVELFDEFRRAGQHEAALRKIALIHFVDSAKIDGVFADAFKEHLESVGLEIIAAQLAALERLPAPQVAGAVEADDLVGHVDAEMRQGTADGGLLSEQEIVDSLICVQQDDIVVLTQRACPPW